MARAVRTFRVAQATSDSRCARVTYAFAALLLATSAPSPQNQAHRRPRHLPHLSHRRRSHTNRLSRRTRKPHLALPPRPPFRRHPPPWNLSFLPPRLSHHLRPKPLGHLPLRQRAQTRSRSPRLLSQTFRNSTLRSTRRSSPASSGWSSKTLSSPSLARQVRVRVRVRGRG